MVTSFQQYSKLHTISHTVKSITSHPGKFWQLKIKLELVIFADVLQICLEHWVHIKFRTVVGTDIIYIDNFYGLGHNHMNKTLKKIFFRKKLTILPNEIFWSLKYFQFFFNCLIYFLFLFTLFSHIFFYLFLIHTHTHRGREDLLETQVHQGQKDV